MNETKKFEQICHENRYISGDLKCMRTKNVRQKRRKLEKVKIVIRAQWNDSDFYIFFFHVTQHVRWLIWNFSSVLLFFGFCRLNLLLNGVSVYVCNE